MAKKKQRKKKNGLKKVKNEMNDTVKTLGGLVLVGAVAGMLPKG